MVDEDDDVVSERLAGRQLRCGCGGSLAPWGRARIRTIRHLDADADTFRPRRGRCATCAATHVLLPCSTLVRRRDSVQTIGAALLAHVRGHGHRRIARRLDRPASTVRGWLRRSRAVAEPLRVTATVYAHDCDPLLPPIEPTGSQLGDAVQALGAAAAASRRRLGGRSAGWQRIACITGGRLLASPSSA
jgi:hypothetical protein